MCECGVSVCECAQMDMQVWVSGCESVSVGCVSVEVCECGVCECGVCECGGA